MAATDASAAAAADVARGAVKSTAAGIVRGAAKPTAADADDADATAPAVPSSPAAAPLAVASRLYNCGQGMGAAGTSIPRPRVLDPYQSFPQFIRLNVCHHRKHFLFNIEREGKAIQNSTFFVCRTDAVLFEFHHEGFRSGDIVPDGLFSYISNVSSSNFFFALSWAASLLSPIILDRISDASEGDPAVITISKGSYILQSHSSVLSIQQ